MAARILEYGLPPSNRWRKRLATALLVTGVGLLLLAFEQRFLGLIEQVGHYSDGYTTIIHPRTHDYLASSFVGGTVVLASLAVWLRAPKAAAVAASITLPLGWALLVGLEYPHAMIFLDTFPRHRGAGLYSRAQVDWDIDWFLDPTYGWAWINTVTAMIGALFTLAWAWLGRRERLIG